MFWKLLISAVLSLTAAAIVSRFTTDPEALIFVLIPMTLGLFYHREIMPAADKRLWFALLMPTTNQLYVRYTIFGYPVTTPRSVRLGAGASLDAGLRLSELMPWFLARLLRTSNSRSPARSAPTRRKR
jgi:hypothetical protein